MAYKVKHMGGWVLPFLWDKNESWGMPLPQSILEGLHEGKCQDLVRSLRGAHLHRVEQLGEEPLPAGGRGICGRQWTSGVRAGPPGSPR